MHVLFIPSWFSTQRNPALGSFFRDQALAVSRQGVRIGIIYPEFLSLVGASIGEALSHRFQIETIIDEGIPTLRVKGWLAPTLRCLSKAHWVFQVHRLLRAYIDAYGRPDVIHAHCVHQGGVAASEIKRQYGLPFVVTEHFTGYASKELSERSLVQAERVFEDANCIISVSQYLAGHLRRYCGNREIHVIPNLVDLDLFSLPHVTRSVEPFVFVFIGFLTARKGVDRLLRAFSESFKGNDSVRLIVGGDGAQRVELEALSRKLGVRSKVDFTGLLLQQEVRDLMWRSNAIVSASKIETFGVTLIEAMSTGLPVIAANSGGPAEFINDSVGTLVPTNDEHDLGSAMLEVFEKRQVWAESASQIRNYVGDLFGARVVARKLLDVYRSVLK